MPPRLLLVGALAAWAPASITAACSVPDVTFAQDATTTSSGSTTATGMGGGAATSTSTGGGNGGASTTTSTVSTSSQGGTGQGGSGGCATDFDGDLVVAEECGGEDCNDHDGAVKPGQMDYFTGADQNGSFDYDCNGMEDKNPAQLLHGTGVNSCTVGECAGGLSGYLANAECGKTLQFVKCQGVAPCAAQSATPAEALKCR